MILIINTSSSGIGLALHNANNSPLEGESQSASVVQRDAVRGIIKHIPTEKQSLSLPTETEKFLIENGATWRDLTAIGVVVGPGSFTGIRLGIAYSKGLSIGLGIPLISINAFEIYLEKTPDAFVAIDSGRGDFFVGARDLSPQVMTIEEVETKQFDYPKTVGHKPFDLLDALPIITRKLSAGANEPVIPMYIKPSYAEQNCKSS
ncbi:MAG: tRNA (adenosine(37)-N6)-threonylcarbamoyltransferase complex dimerization subunit type 1 TsaB [Alphaproteobacteria bacterium]|nr:tRNA (adenosine(37)-N6)-threonylcarbamoyltransferase complex dimerization subunit type 1 TsaB [Alphaproteobacteria bacterium]